MACLFDIIVYLKKKEWEVNLEEGWQEEGGMTLTITNEYNVLSRAL